MRWGGCMFVSTFILHQVVRPTSTLSLGKVTYGHGSTGSVIKMQIPGPLSYSQAVHSGVSAHQSQHEAPVPGGGCSVFLSSARLQQGWRTCTTNEENCNVLPPIAPLLALVHGAHSSWYRRCRGCAFHHPRVVPVCSFALQSKWWVQLVLS